MDIGKIVKSSSHIAYVCQVYGPREVEQAPVPADYAFGRFVRVQVRSKQASSHGEQRTPELENMSSEPRTYVIGVIYDTILVNPEFGSLGPRLSDGNQVELFSPDYISERAVLVSIMVLGMFQEQLPTVGHSEMRCIRHGVPLLSLELGSEIETLADEEVKAFHYFSEEAGASAPPFLHMGYLPHLLAQRNSLIPMVILQMIEQLERLLPNQTVTLSIVKRNFAWRLKVETTG